MKIAIKHRTNNCIDYMTLVLDQTLTKVRSQPLGLDQSLDLSLVLDQIAGVRLNSVLSLDLDPSLV